MAFSSLGQLVGGLERRPQWRSHHQFQAILEHWPIVVGPVVAAQTQPMSIHRHWLNVSTSSSVWAQNLAFQRHHILEKLSLHVPNHPVQDIRFSPAQWTDLRPSGAKGRSLKDYYFDQSEARVLWSYHPSQLPPLPATMTSTGSGIHPSSDTPSQVFHDWATQIQARSQHLPKCPRCQCPTPIGELKRWAVCSLCAAKQWQG